MRDFCASGQLYDTISWETGVSFDERERMSQEEVFLCRSAKHMSLR